MGSRASSPSVFDLLLLNPVETTQGPDWRLLPTAAKIVPPKVNLTSTSHHESHFSKLLHSLLVSEFGRQTISEPKVTHEELPKQAYSSLFGRRPHTMAIPG
jgi:hypothetical protein